ncbi:MAG: UDP-N-acetylglucosamine 1-carboxyvinyltransferase [Candidatus Magasanikbacteria bacterium]|nr:UDP-N-acetylglucosamine 1-carboxyvinyltransferase [Candidatus Magasanikbacteria bacterium]
MAYFRIKGQQKLQGEIAVNGAKNAALKFIAAALVCDGPVVLRNMPNIEDVFRMLELIQSLGATVEHDTASHTITIDASTLNNFEITPKMARAVRTSIMLVGPLLVRFGKACGGYPGGDSIGRRPIDLYLKGYERFGAEVTTEDKTFEFIAPELHAMTFMFPLMSVVATETFMMTAARIKGTTVLKNAAQEPEIVELANFLNTCGAKITGAGTPTIEIEGVDSLTGGEATMIPDRIETGTFVILGALMRSRVRVTNCNPEHVENILLHLEAAGVPFEVGEDWIETKPYEHTLRAINIKTHEYPGFMTDLQAPFTVLLTQANGISLVHETIWEGRMFYIDRLNHMGANIILCDPHRALVEGPTPLYGRTLESPDIRAGIAMVLAGLIAHGETTIGNIEQIERGYEAIDARLQALGADITRVA